jgi:hypothetical protein
LAKQYDQALSVFRDFSKSPPPAFNDKDLSEMYLFEARILEESGKKREALDFLKNIKSMANQLGKEEICGRLELELGLFQDAQERFLFLVKDRNTENYDYHRGLQVRRIFASPFLFIADHIATVSGLPITVALSREELKAL